MSTKSQETSENQCLGCGKHDAPFECTGCNEVSFCSQDCQRNTWSTHRFDCLPCSICGERVPGILVRRDCACKKGGYSHVTCLVKEAVEDSGGKEWSFSSDQFEKCKLCGEPFTGDTKKVLDRERKARVEKAKGKLHHLLDVCQDAGNEMSDLNHSDVMEYGAMAEKAIDIARELHDGEEDANSIDTFWAFYCLARAFLVIDKSLLDLNEEEKSEENFKLALAEAEKHKTSGRTNRLKLATMWLADTYMSRNKYSEALPLLEEVYDKYYQLLGRENQFCTANWLTDCYSHTRMWKKARNMAVKAREQCEGLYGGNDRRTLKLIEHYATIIDASFNPAKTYAVENLPDGTTVEIAGYSNGYFDIALLSVSSERGLGLGLGLGHRLFHRFSRTSHYDSGFGRCPSQSQGCQTFEWKAWYCRDV